MSTSMCEMCSGLGVRYSGWVLCVCNKPLREWLVKIRTRSPFQSPIVTDDWIDAALRGDAVKK